jgi:hypothetical protein
MTRQSVGQALTCDILEGLAIREEDGLLAREHLPSPDRDIHIKRVEFDP